ncbi:MAG: hypothetical protein COW01_02300 [Bdellovibrionales bacterium CG12_big_fil_rev_8_21_14_0_65_38_15]|nr:MAG: hypothetical protein COW79_02535 [Bdellovibrionales bacterium CG22_combo_CG10-13_8_21_14_all_38_13]PIQ57138.1 MAG: hypothetical protein COW01_02300 [Bdellovibrionales bacterium CG12_big_fil_rev_8_21_14_0_65_38_15]PIR30168.1 MAG: hypothetical protein COV38_07695 [Bdellovibrionales bacterium CG11_big_fil_rev_8_21_14_0_20_38_13]
MNYLGIILFVYLICFTTLTISFVKILLASNPFKGNQVRSVYIIFQTIFIIGASFKIITSNIVWSINSICIALFFTLAPTFSYCFALYINKLKRV